MKRKEERKEKIKKKKEGRKEKIKKKGRREKEKRKRRKRVFNLKLLLFSFVFVSVFEMLLLGSK